MADPYRSTDGVPCLRCRLPFLERRIAKLERQLAEVRSFVGTRFRWTAWRE